MHINGEIGTNILIESLFSDLNSPKEQTNNDSCDALKPEMNNNTSPHM